MMWDSILASILTLTLIFNAEPTQDCVEERLKSIQAGLTYTKDFVFNIPASPESRKDLSSRW